MNNFTKRYKNTLFNYIDVMLKTFMVLIIISTIVIPVKVKGKSMDITLHDGQRLLVSKLSYKVNEPEHKDIVVLKTSTKKLLIKRVIGIAGDELEINDNKLFINGSEIFEEYIKENMSGNDYIHMIIPDGYVFVMGDNRNISLDSRSTSIGLINIDDDIIGKVLFK